MEQEIALIFYSFHFKAAFHNCLTQISWRWFMQELFPSRQFSPKSETALGPIALGSKSLAEVFRALRESWPSQVDFMGLRLSASRGEAASNDQAWLYDLGKFGGLPPPAPRLLTLCVQHICKYNAGPKSVWKYTHLANNHHKPYAARISFSSKLVSIVFF